LRKDSGNITTLVITVFILLFPTFLKANEKEKYLNKSLEGIEILSFQEDTSMLRYPFSQKNNYPFYNSGQNSPIYGRSPSNVENVVEYDPVTGKYYFTEKAGNISLRSPNVMSREEYMKYEAKKSKQDYWQQKASGENLQNSSSFIPQLNIGGEAFDKVFGSNTINIVPAGSAELIFGFNLSKVDNPTLTEKLRRTPSFTFEEKILMNVTGSIGDKMQLDVNYDTEATFDFENKTKLEYSGKEDEIIKKIEAGNVSLPLSGSLITGSQSLFGLKTEMQFGKMTMTTIFSQQKGESSVIEVQGGAQVQEYDITADNYDVNKHYFLSNYFRDRYNTAMANLPVINSAVNITRIEVWITNKTSNFEDSRNIVAYTDLAEADPFSDLFYPEPSESGEYPRNEKNDLYQQMTTGTYAGVRNINNVTSILAPLTLGVDYEKIENARMLSSREYTYNSKLGYISLNSALNSDEILAVAYEYTYNGKTYRVGELSSAGGVSAPDALFLKLLKGTNFTPNSPTWDLMMKNVYAIGAYQVNPEDFVLDVLYQDDKTGNAINYIPEGDLNKKVLLKLLNLDNLNSNNDPYPDGLFDFISGTTINASNGRVYFPVIEPFGSDLEKIIRDNIGDDETLIRKYVFQELYDSTKTKAQQIAEKNKFKLAGVYQSSSSSEIMLNAMNVPQGSVVVTAGGRQLSEGVDFTVDYTLGRVTIINQGLLESGTPIRISLESNSLFNIQTKTLVGTHLDYRISEDFNIGATILNLTERPLTQKVNIGDEPISNTIWGINTSYRTESQWLTNLVDKLPLIETKEPSSITFTGEFAHLIPGHSKAIEKEGNAYIDDFEGSETSIDLKSFAAWSIASAPTGLDFPEASLNNNLEYGYGRARLAWYVIDPLFLRNNSLTPSHIKNNPDLQSSHYVREIFEKDIFPKKESPNNIPTNISVLNLAYYPRERGPYNYDYLNVEIDGSLKSPEKRWGGIMREVQSSDFEAANIEYIEFWLMDPYAEDPTNPGGDLFFNLGNISEDVLKDSRKSFENGLPSSPVIELVDTTSWGRVPLVQSLVNAFNNEIEARQYQDVGLDGLSDADEASFFQSFLNNIQPVISPDAFAALAEDPSSDNFHYYRGSDYDRAQLGILERYKKYNGLEGNSPTAEQSKEPYPTTGTTLPNVEDINRDNTLSESETYYSYRISLRPSDLEIGQNFIIDKQIDEAEFENGAKSSVTWYQFRVPIYNYERVVGDIQDFKSIRFMRMFLSDFSDSVILRFAKLDLIRGEWRKYNNALIEGGEAWTGNEPANSEFEISAVNIEENAGKEPVNYVLPPGINRVIDPTQPQIRQLNEQSIVLKAIDLEDGASRAAYKNVSMDIRQYKTIEMEAHAEAIDGYPLTDNEITAFLRIGSDYKNNFYEYEVPLKLTPHGTYTDDESDRLTVWPRENRFEIDLSVFQQAKQARNDAMRDPESMVEITTLYTILDGKNKVSVSGNPNMANVRTIMIGIRNPKSGGNSVSDDGIPKSVEVWLNELRLSNFDENGGWAANGRVTTKLADFGSFTFAGNTSTPGFGSIEKKVQERDQEHVYQYDLSSNFELGKFFPDKTGVSIPMYAGYSESIINPLYNPLDPDIPLEAALANAGSDAARDSIKKVSQDYVRRRSINFTNVRLVKQEGKPHIYDLANWSASYSFNEIDSRNISTEYYTQRKYRASLNYNFNSRPKAVTPFAKSKMLSSPYLRIIRDFNFYYLPSRISFRTDMNRNYSETKLRNLNNPFLEIEPVYKKDFLWNRYYDVKFDLTRALKLDFSASNIARIDEPLGRMNKEDDDYELKKDSILQEIKSFGRTTSYNHQINATYNLPLNKIPFLNWVNISTRYNASFAWDAGPIIKDPEIDLGNVIKNSNSYNINGQLNVTNLYNKVPYLKDLNQKYRSKSSREQQANKRTREVTYERENQVLRPDFPRSYTHKLKTENIKVNVYNADNQLVEVETEVINENRVKIVSKTDVRGARIEIIGTKDLGENPLTFMVENSVRFITGIKNINLTYTNSDGTVLPGYKPATTILGMQNYNGIQSPGIPFILGMQDPDFAQTAYNNGWLSTDSLLNSPFMLNHNEKFSLRATFEPFNGLRVDLTANRDYSENLTEFYTANASGQLPESGSDRGRRINGNFSMSYLSWNTAFERIYSKSLDFESAAFLKFKNDYRQIVSERLALQYMRENPGEQLNFIDSTGYYEGFGENSQQVMISAFMAAYGSKNPSKVSLNPFPSITQIMPNWRVSFDGLSKIDIVKRYLNSLTINHAYRSSYNVGSYISNPFEEIDQFDLISGDLIPLYDASSVSINEQFSPLFDINMDWKNSLTTRVEFKRSRTLALSTANNQVNESNSKDFIIGLGYRFNEVQLIINQKEYNSDLNVRADLSIRDNRTVIRKLSEDSDQITAGQRIISIKTSLDYVLSDRFNLRFFFDQRINRPFVSLSYPTSNTNIGFSVQFTLAQ
jgi:cell surface protein SprA